MGELERKLFALPVHLGGLGLADPSAVELGASESVTSALTNQILQQQNNYDVTFFSEQRLPFYLQRVLSLSSEKGASSWLSILPIEDHGFALYTMVGYQCVFHPNVTVETELLLIML